MGVLLSYLELLLICGGFLTNINYCRVSCKYPSNSVGIPTIYDGSIEGIG